MEKQYKETWLVGGRSYNINELDDVCTVTAIGFDHTKANVTDISLAAHALSTKISQRALATNKTVNVIVLLNVEECNIHSGMLHWCKFLTNNLKHNAEINKYCIITNKTFDIASNPYPNIISIDWFLHSTICVYRNELLTFPAWEPTNLDVLFLPGKLPNANRFPALYYFLHDEKIKEKIKYSCITFEEMSIWLDGSAAKLLDNFNSVFSTSYSEKELCHIVNSIARTIDRPFINTTGRRDFDMIDPLYYENVAVEIVAETSAGQPKFITEKSFKPIVLGYPFVHIHCQFTDRLQSLGFKVFQSWLPHDTARDSRDYHNEFKTCVENVDRVVNNIQQLKFKHIQASIKHNQELSINIHNNTVNSIANIIPDFGDIAHNVFTHYATLGRETNR